MRASTSASMAVASTSRAAACARARGGRRRGDATRRVRGSLARARTRGVRGGARDWARRGWRRGRAATRQDRDAFGVAGRTGAGFEIRVVVRARRRVSRGRRRNTRGRRGRTFARRFRRFRRCSDRLRPPRDARGVSVLLHLVHRRERGRRRRSVRCPDGRARRRRNGHGTEALVEPPGAPVAAWPPWLAEEVATTFDEAEFARASGDETDAPPKSRGGVCAGGGVRGQGVLQGGLGGDPPPPRRRGAGDVAVRSSEKVLGAAKRRAWCASRGARRRPRTCVDARDGGRHGGRADRPLGYVPRSNFVYERRREGEDAASAATPRAQPPRRAVSPWKPPAGGAMAAAAAAVEKGGSTPSFRPRGEARTGTQDGTETKKKTDPRRPGLTRARRASERAATAFGDAAEYVFESTKPVT